MPSRSACRLDRVLDIVSDLWTLGIVHELSLGPRRTVELHASFDGLSSKTLAARLKKLEREGLLVRKSYPETPPRVEYSLTEKGRDLLLILSAVAEVAGKWDSPSDRSRVAPACRACEANGDRQNEPPDNEPTDAASTPPRPRRRTDVTLL